MNREIKVDEAILLKPIEMEDESIIYHTINCQRGYLGKWLPFIEYTQKIEDTESYIISKISKGDSNLESVFTINYRQEFAGLIRLRIIDTQKRKTEIGYWLSEGFQKKGVMTRSVARLCEYSFKVLGIAEVEIKCAVGNIRSKEIPKRLGFTLKRIDKNREKLTGDIWTDVEVYGKLKNEILN